MSFKIFSSNSYKSPEALEKALNEYIAAHEKDEIVIVPHDRERHNQLIRGYDVIFYPSSGKAAKNKPGEMPDFLKDKIAFHKTYGVTLSDSQLEYVRKFYENKGVTLSVEELLNVGEIQTEASLRHLISLLRGKLKDTDLKIQTVSGIGYSMY